jgi:hypothetical protein
VIVAHLVKKFHVFNGTEISLSCSQQPASGLCPKPYECSPFRPTLILQYSFGYYVPSTPRSSKMSLLFKCSDQNLCEFLTFRMRATWFAYLTILDLIMFGEGYIILNFSLCRFLEHPVISSLLYPNIPLSFLFSDTLNLCSSFIARVQV